MSRPLGFAVLSLFAFGAADAAPGASPKPPSLCLAEEQPVLSCGAGRKVISLCATGDLTAQGASGVKMQYRFGRQGAVEMRYPAQPAAPAGVFFLSTTLYSGGGEERIRFASGGYDYVVFQRTIAGEWDDEGHRGHYQDEGVAVMKAGKVVGRHICTTEATNDGFPKMYDVLAREETGPLDIPCCGER